LAVVKKPQLTTAGFGHIIIELNNKEPTMLATTKLIRKFARAINGKGFGYAGTFTDKCKRDEGLRHVTFRLYDKAEADTLAKELEAMLFIAGYTNKVKRTSSERDIRFRTWGGEYVRLVAAVA
jgi:hypothetical protein